MATTTPHLESTIQSLEGGLESARNGATSTINGWVETLNDSDDEALNNIASELEDFAELLGNEDASAEEIRKALISLGKHTDAAAKKAEGVTSQKLQELAKQLTDGANSL